jgi:hypothetical protein
MVCLREWFARSFNPKALHKAKASAAAGLRQHSIWGWYLGVGRLDWRLYLQE